MNQRQDMETSAKARGKRLRALREALRLSRQKFADKHAIPKGTLQNWEDGRFRGLSEKGAERVIRAMEAEDIHCTIEWLMYGSGQPPALPSSILQQRRPWAAGPETTQEQIIEQELLLFHQLNPDSIDTIIADDSMAPAYLPGDHVAGQRYFSDDIVKAVSHDCIVQTAVGDTLVCNVKAGSKVDHYHLLAKGRKDKNVRLFSAAPIVWVRRLRVT